MGRNRVPGLLVQQRSLAYVFIAGMILLSGCVTTSTLPEIAWVRTDGRKIADDPVLLQQGKSDIAACDADLDSGPPTASARGCIARRGTCLCKGIRQRTCARHTLPLRNGVLPTDKST